ncbi:hypothetical protein Terro_4380 [Terriglobus roseus DSM 18391]|uniref:TIGR02453 family protein n=1 Tax=Terriglobus roseus (strain DSM 18391 / NRRL B-41598 / KBS 63) TaxID=926566 RepID=I3ZMV9_TERRK|nr:DUF2461 domain-containing protein [Terriglobus roseus]AFL90577.1 hypothetical protein Terro_4380 [Terriglobus roseus DSM 18391]
MATHFAPAGIKFLKGLKRHNDRTWFADRKGVYEAEVQAPWLALIDEINEALIEFAPECVKPAKKAMFRIYRDTRFSNNKLPYKTHVGAWWSPASLAKTSGGGFYAHVGSDEVVVAAGVYMPQPEQLLAIRRHMQQAHGEMRAMLADKKLRKLMPELDSNPLKRMPKGFAAEDPAADLLLCRQWALSATLPVDVAMTPKLGSEIVKRFRAMAPMVALLNAPLLRSAAPRKSLF